MQLNDQERWQTPPEVFEPLMREFQFDLDAAADPVTKRIPRYQDDSLCGSRWDGDTIWMNPPYGRKLEPFVREAYRQSRFGMTIAVLIPFRCRGAWWHECVIGQSPQVRCYRKRISFLRLDGSRGKFTGSCDSCLVVYRGNYRGSTEIVSA